MEKLRNNKFIKKLVQILTMLPFLAIGGLCGYLAVSVMDGYFGSDADFRSFVLTIVAALLILYPGMFLQVIVHEAGHLVFGLLTGYKFESFRIGSFMFVKKGDKIELKRFSLLGTAGQCLMSPPPLNDGDFPVVLYNMGGCIANIVLSGLMLLVWYLTPDVLILPEAAMVIALIGFALALTNGIPITAGAVDNDGSNTITLAKSRTARISFWKQLQINSLVSAGTRLRDIDEALFEMPPYEEMNDVLTTSVGMFAFSRAIDSLDFDKARDIGQNLLNIKSRMVEIHRYMLTAEMIFLELIGDCSEERINELYTNQIHKFIKSAKTMPSAPRLTYAYSLLFECDEIAAAKALVDFEKAAKKYPHEADIIGERELLAIVKQKYEEMPIFEQDPDAEQKSE